jgi:hypothetical protein
VNLSLPLRSTALRGFSRAAYDAGFCELQQRGSCVVVQTLGKLYFFELIENLRRILLDYAQKRTGRANATFNAAC